MPAGAKSAFFHLGGAGAKRLQRATGDAAPNCLTGSAHVIEREVYRGRSLYSAIISGAERHVLEAVLMNGIAAGVRVCTRTPVMPCSA